MIIETSKHQEMMEGERVYPPSISRKACSQCNPFKLLLGIIPRSVADRRCFHVLCLDVSVEQLHSQFFKGNHKCTLFKKGLTDFSAPSIKDIHHFTDF